MVGAVRVGGDDQHGMLVPFRMPNETNAMFTNVEGEWDESWR